jgi:inosine-uridine nucleoside N-ribohydrolase
MYGRDHAPQHDVLAVVPWIDEGAIAYDLCSGTVSTESDPTWGMSVFDTRNRADATAPKNILLARTAERDRLIGAVMESLLSYG